MANTMKKLKSLKFKEMHGASGIVCLLSGFILSLCSIFGEYSLLRSNFIYVFLISSVINAFAGWLLNAGNATTKFGFRIGVGMMFSLSYYAFRFRPKNLHFELFPEFHKPILTVLDYINVTFMWACVIGSFVSSFLVLFGFGLANKPYMAVGPFFGAIGLLLMSIYPVHVAMGGEQWIDCIIKRYPAQREGFSGYVFIPTAWTVAAVFFGVTLLRRKVVDNFQFTMIFVVFCVGMFLATVLSQEVHIPFVSTQKLVIPCEAPEPGSWLELIVPFLDTSSPAQKFWKFVNYDIGGRPAGWDNVNVTSLPNIISNNHSEL